MPLWLYLGVGLVAGFLPSRWFWSRGMLFLDGPQLRSRLSLAPVDNRRRRRWWKFAGVWVDPLRGVLAGWMLTRGICYETADLSAMVFFPIYYGAFAAAAGFVILHSLGRMKQQEVMGPILFLGGLLTGFWGWVVGPCTLAVGMLALLALQSVGAAFLAMAATMAVLGWFLIGFSDMWLVGIGVCGLPVTIAFFFRYRMVVAVRG